MFHRVKEVEPLDNYILKIIFDSDVIKFYDIKPLFNRWNIFKSLITIKGLFEQVKVDVGGYGIYWNDEIDLSCNELWENSSTIL